MNKFLDSITGNRVIIFLVLFLILVGLCIYYYDNYMTYQDHPGTGAILLSYPEGQMVAVSGTVTSISPGSFYIKEEYQDKTVTYQIISSENVSAGDKVQVLGLLGQDYQITASQMKITTKWDNYLLLLRSFLAFFFLLFIFHRYWRFNWKQREFVRRK